MKELVKHLSILKRQGVIRAWHDRQIGGGHEWAGEIDSHLNSAQVILLLISSDFLASDYCYDLEMMRAMERHEMREARVVPVILRPVDWKGSLFSKLQGFPKDGKPVTSWTSRDEAFLDIARGIRSVVEELTIPEKQGVSDTISKPKGATDQVLTQPSKSSTQPRQGVTMNQNNSGNSRAQQVLVQDGTAYIGGEIHVNQGGFYQPNWKVNTVNQAQGDINITNESDRQEKVEDSGKGLEDTQSQQ